MQNSEPIILPSIPSKKPGKLKIIVIIGSALAALVLSTITYVAFRTPTSSSVIIDPSPHLAPIMTPTLIPTPPKDATSLNILLLGYGGAGHQGGYLTDVMMLAHVNFEKKILALISIPRDLWVTYPDNQSRKVNAAFALSTKTDSYTKQQIDIPTAKNAGSQAKAVVETITGLPVHYFIGTDFVGFERAISSLGGIDITLNTAFEDPWYPIKGLELELCGWSPEDVTKMSATMSGFMLEKQFPCRYERVAYGKGTHHINGEQALKIARSRHSSSDFERSTRQQAILLGLKEKLTSLGALDNIPQFFSELSKETKTDLTLDVVNYLNPLLKTIPGLKVVKVNLSTANALQSSTGPGGAFILIPKSGMDDWASLHAFIQNELKGI